MRVCNREISFASWWLAYILSDLRYIQRFPEVMTSCPRVYTYPLLYSSIECYQVCSSRHSLVWMVRLHSGRWGDSGVVHALYRGRNCGWGGSNGISPLSLGDPVVIWFWGPWFFLFLLNFSTRRSSGTNFVFTFSVCMSYVLSHVILMRILLHHPGGWDFLKGNF